MRGRVFFIGAGCGSFDLITLRGISRLKLCDVVMYDALIDERLLELVPDGAELICVGKRSGAHSVPQEETNRILAEKAASGHTVARLKGGDPFVFGRGGEEAEALDSAGVPYEFVPGITSAVAVPELAGIPATHRRVSRSFHVITAHTADGGEDFSQYASIEGTLVFLMGLNRLPDIAAGLIKGGMSGETPAAVISEGCTPRQHAVRASLSDIAECAARENCKAPAVIVVGETARYDFSGSISLPLSGKSIAVTGTPGFTGRLRERLEALGAAVTVYSCVKIKDYGDTPEVSAALNNIGGFGCIVLTSANGAELFIRRLRERHMDIRRLSGLRLAVIGSATAAVFERLGIYPDIVPESFTSAALGEAIVRELPPEKRILILRAEQGSRELTDILSAAGREYSDVKLYDTAADTERIPQYIDEDYIVFASASGAAGFISSGAEISDRTKIVCIGHNTAAACERFGNVLTAFPHTAEGVVNAILREETK